jgi:hypothetical protein
MRKFYLLQIVLLTLILSGCGKRLINRGIVKDSPRGGVSSASSEAAEFQEKMQSVVYNNEDDATEAWQDASYTCADSNTCLPGVGAVFTLSGNEVKLCTAILVSEDSAVTDSRCFSVGVNNKKTKSSESGNCGGNSRILFPEGAGAKSTEVSCSEFINLKNKPGLSAQLVKIKFKKKVGDRNPIAISAPARNFTVKNEDDLILIHAQLGARVEGGVVATQERKVCKVTQKTRGLLQESSDAPYIRLKNCAMGDGGIGAPLFSEKLPGEAVGVIAANGSKKSKSTKEKATELEVKDPKPYVIGLHSKCIGENLDSCFVDKVKSNQAIQARLEKELQDKWANLKTNLPQESKALVGKIKDFKGRKNGEEIFRVKDPKTCQTYVVKYEINSDFEEDIVTSTEKESCKN